MLEVTFYMFHYQSYYVEQPNNIYQNTKNPHGTTLNVLNFVNKILT